MIELSHIFKTYGQGEEVTHVLSDISFSIKQGEFVAVMGPSGSGKSTIMNILGLLDVPSKGAYFLEGKDVSRLSDDAQALIRGIKIGFVFQSFNLLPRTTVLRNVMLPLMYNTSIKEEDREVIAQKALISAGFPKERWGVSIQSAFWWTNSKSCYRSCAC
ncbi:MAG: hypothetical protein RLZZ308_703 [Candidatus Parcubacteria bacterium]|jgi:putative ABC transport system ATP-binding protein